MHSVTTSEVNYNARRVRRQLGTRICVTDATYLLGTLCIWHCAADHGWDDGWSICEGRIDWNVVYVAEGCSVFAGGFAVENGIGGEWEATHAGCCRRCGG